MKELRLRRLLDLNDSKMLITPLDHGITLGPIDGIQNIQQTVHRLAQTEVNAVVLHKGNIMACKDVLAKHKDLSIIMHLNASMSFSPNSIYKVLVGCVEEAARLGVDAVSIHVNVGNEFDYKMIEDFGRVSYECQKWGIPLLAMMYPRGNSIDESDTEFNRHAARVAMELGADIVKVNYSGDQESFSRLIEGVHIPVLISGGEFNNNIIQFLQSIKDAMEAGASGVAIGRNVFQHPDMRGLVWIIDQLVHHNAVLEEIIHMLKGDHNHENKYGALV